MDRISESFLRLSRKNEGALIAYVTAGDPKAELTVRIGDALVEGGADILELGLPALKPTADGPTIRRSFGRALKTGTSSGSFLEIVRSIRRHHSIPIVALCYSGELGNRPGSFLKKLAESGVDGIIVPDLTTGGSPIPASRFDRLGLSHIWAVAPGISPSLLERTILGTKGFLYVKLFRGVTGVRHQIPVSAWGFVTAVSRSCVGRVPIAVGFGISKPAQISVALSKGANGAIVGSALVRIIEANLGAPHKIPKALSITVRRLKSATKGARDKPHRLL